MKLQVWPGGEGDKNKIYMLPTLSAFYEAHDIEPDKRIAMIISMKNHLHMFADEILSCFPNLHDTKSTWHLQEALSQLKLKVFLRQYKEFIELSNSSVARANLISPQW